MGSGKRQDGEEATSSRRLAVFSGPAGVPFAAVLGLLFFVLVVMAVVYGWRKFGKNVVARPVYRIKAENIQLTPPPAWIRTDVRSEIVHDGALDNLTIFDKDATIRVFQAFELHPWVAKVLRVSKHPPARLVVDVEYRQPIAWVEVPGAKPGEEGGVIPIDQSAYVLPSRDFTKDDLVDYLRISIQDVRPYGLAGTAWGDSRVVEAAKIAAHLQGCWQSLHLYRIQLVTDFAVAKSQAQPIYEIETTSHHKIIWGSPPGMETSGEPNASLKLSRLKQLADSHGSLDQLPPTGSDLRDLNQLQASINPTRERTGR
jgi:hypothetical protein